MKRNFIWVVEIKFDDDDKWQPTVGAALTRDDARKEMKKWKDRNVAKFRISRYVYNAT